MKNLLLVLSLVIVASPAFASRARLESLGEGKNGSYFVNDSRDIFLNPAAINSYKKKLFLELGTASGAVDTSAASKAQGGFTNTFGDFTYGLYLGRESDRAANAVVTANTILGANTFIASDHAFDFFFGGETGIKWGADVFYAGALDQNSLVAGTKKTASLFGIKLGVDLNNINIFTTLGLSSDTKNATASTTTDSELKGNLSLDAAVTYNSGDMTYFAKFTNFSSDLTSGTAAGVAGATITPTTTAYGIGTGWKHEATKSVTMFSRFEIDYQKNNTKTVTAAGVESDSSTTSYNLPIVLAAEAQATSWLSVRGSVSHSLLGQSQTSGSAKTSYDNMTTVAAGLGFNFGDLTIDTLFGQSAALAGAASEASQGTVQAGNTAGFGDNFASRIAMTYNF